VVHKFSVNYRFFCLLIGYFMTLWLSHQMVGWQMNDELKRIWKKWSWHNWGMSWHLPGGTKETDEIPVRIAGVWPRFEPSTSQIQVYSVTTRPTSSVILLLNQYGFIYLFIVCSSIVGWGTTLQARRSWVRILMSLDFSIDLILPAALWPWGWLSL
jgi:hypothetical protein